MSFFARICKAIGLVEVCAVQLLLFVTKTLNYRRGLLSKFTVMNKFIICVCVTSILTSILLYLIHFLIDFCRIHIFEQRGSTESPD